MEFNYKLQQLRKEKGLTQEQLAEELYVSRTAISKWESGKGYPNIESLKSISKLFSVSIDDLLSSEELISLAEDENRSNVSRIYSLIFGVLDLMTLSFLFLPLYTRADSDLIRTVSLFSNPDASVITWTIYIAVPIIMALTGIIQILMQRYSINEKWRGVSRTGSILLQAFFILAYVATRQPYAVALIFLFFMIKVVLLIKGNRIQ